MKAPQTWQEMLAESLKDPDFRKEWETANAELASLDQMIAAGTDAAPGRAPDAGRKESSRATATDSKRSDTKRTSGAH